MFCCGFCRRRRPLLLVLIFTALAHAIHRKKALTAFVGGGLLLIINQGYWEQTTGTLALVLASAFFCMAFGVPVGIAAAHRPWLYSVMRPVLDLMQTIPTFVYLIPALVLFGLGEVPGLIATRHFCDCRTDSSHAFGRFVHAENIAGSGRSVWMFAAAVVI